MRLIACGNCHAQYDVSGVIADTVTCRCGDTIENRDLTPVDAEIHRCGACGAQVEAVAESCGYCGSEIVREGELSLICPECFARNEDGSRFCTACGVAFRPEPLCVDGHELPCPACDATMPPGQVAGIGLNECPKCNGLWVPGESFDALVRRAIEARRNAEQGEGDAPAPRRTGGNPLDSRVQYRKCPECQGFMQRRNYQRSSGVILDVCHTHGTWLDADELEQIAGFILSRGSPETSTSAIADIEHRNVPGRGSGRSARGAHPHCCTEYQRHSARTVGAAFVRSVGLSPAR